MLRGVFLDLQTLSPQDLDLSVLTSTLDWELYDLTVAHQVPVRIQDADVIVTNKVRITASDLEHAPRLRCICIAATGSDHVDLKAAHARGITVCNVVGYSTNSVAQHTIGLIIALASSICAYDSLVKQGDWSRSALFCLQNFSMMELSSKVLGIVGYGSIGRTVADIARALGMTTLIAQREGQTLPGRLAFKELLPLVDVLTLHCPLSADTHHLIGDQELSLMKQGAFLINVARGGLVAEDALARALLSGHLGGAAVDVLPQEPPPATSPLVQKIPNLIVTPHVAWATREARQRLLSEIAANVRAFLVNKPRNIVK